MLWTDFHEVLWVGELWLRVESIRFWTDLDLGLDTGMDQFFHFSNT